MLFYVVLAVAILSAFGAHSVAIAKGYSAIVGLALGLLLGPIGLLILAVLPSRKG